MLPLHSWRKWLLTCLMILVSLSCFLINIDETIIYFTPYNKHFFPMAIILFQMLFASVLLIILCVISFECTWVIIMFGQSFSKIGVLKWSNLLIVIPLKLFSCALSSFIELLNKFLLVFCI